MYFLKLTMFFLIVLGISNVPKTTNDELAVMASSASSAILLDANSERVLYEKNSAKPYLTASIAKIMTAIVAIELGDLNKFCLVDKETISQVGSSIYLQLDDQIKLIDLLHGLMLRSGNDAAYLIATSVSKSLEDFIAEMNKTAKRLNMTSSVFNNPSGLDETTKNYSTAYDMAILMSYAMKNDVFRKIVATTSYRCITKNENIYVFSNKHKLIRSSKYAIGGKTGYTKDAKRTLVTAFKKDNVEVIVVTFNCGDDWNVHERLAEYAFQNFQQILLIKAGIIDINIANYPATPYILEDVTYLLKNDEKIHCIIRLIKKPENSFIIGEICLYIKEEKVKTIPVYRYY